MYPNQDTWGTPAGGPQGPPPGYGQTPPPAWGAPPQAGWGAPAAPVPQQRPVGPPPDPDELMSGGHTAAKFEQQGQVVGGEIIEPPRTEQQRDFDSRQPKFYDDGNPMWQVVVAVQAQPASGEDDGIRAFYLKGQMKKAVQEAVRRAGASRLEVGGTLQIRYVRDEPNSRGRGHDKKIYEARYTPPAGSPAQPAAAPAIPGTGNHASSPVLNKRPAPPATAFDDEPPF